MSEPKEKAKAFLKSHSMHPDDIDTEQVCDAFLEEMDKGLTGQDSSLAMIPTYIETDTPLPKNNPVIVMDVGGTNFRAAVVRFDEHGKASIKKSRKKKMPGIEHEVTSREFFETLADYVRDITDTSLNIGFCFSYPCQMQPSRDGRLIRFSKEIKAPQVIGQMIGENLCAALGRLGFDANKHVVILNDTVTTLLAGLAGFEDKQYDSYVGFILGTGTNT